MGVTPWPSIELTIWFLKRSSERVLINEYLPILYFCTKIKAQNIWAAIPSKTATWLQSYVHQHHSTSIQHQTRSVWLFVIHQLIRWYQVEAAPSAVEAEPEPAAPAAATGIEARREAYMRLPVDPALLTTSKCKGPPARRNVPAKSTVTPRPGPKVWFPTFKCFCSVLYARTKHLRKHKSARQASSQALPLSLDIVDATSSSSQPPRRACTQPSKWQVRSYRLP